MSRKADEQDALPFIRAQFDLFLSNQHAHASLEETLAACAKLQSTSSIIDLLSHAQLGWKPLAPNSGRKDSAVHSCFEHRVHEALFARWGELDFDGAFKRLRPMGRFGFPTHGRGAYDHNWNPTAHLFKGGAMIDGEHAFAVLDETSGTSTFTVISIGPLMEGWAKSDPAAAWQKLIRLISLNKVWRPTIQGYFAGLPSGTSWPDIRDAVEKLERDSEIQIDVNRKAEFHRSLTKAWIRDDPAAALAWYAPYCLETHSSYNRETNVSALSHAEIIANWMQNDLDGSTRWLSNWQPAHVSAAEVYEHLAQMADRDPFEFGTPEMKAAVWKLAAQERLTKKP